MNLHEFPNDFKDLISVVAAHKHLPETLAFEIGVKSCS